MSGRRLIDAIVECKSEAARQLYGGVTGLIDAIVECKSVSSDYEKGNDIAINRCHSGM